ncbi:MAG: hypothetical protein NT094_01465 [Candidatus Staskawiczbacteria bacterium]|nr:hypothetical protein [Candidatus Staskawiczbacteria bacterium]
MNNLEKAKRAISGKRRFRVVIEETDSYEVEIEAKNKEEANDLAMKEYNDGNLSSSGGNGANVIETTELNN